jgi:hypothetical protein
MLNASNDNENFPFETAISFSLTQFLVLDVTYGVTAGTPPFRIENICSMDEPVFTTTMTTLVPFVYAVTYTDV